MHICRSRERREREKEKNKREKEKKERESERERGYLDVSVLGDDLEAVEVYAYLANVVERVR